MKHIKKNITFSFSAFISVSVVFFAVFLSHFAEKIVSDTVKRQLKEDLFLFEDFFKEYSSVNKNFSVPDYMKRVSSFYNSRMTVTDKNGELIFDSKNNTIDSYKYLPEIYSAIKDGYGEDLRPSRNAGENIFFAAKKSGDYILRIARPLPSMGIFFIEMKFYIIFIFVFFALSAAALYFYLHNKVTLPSLKSVEFAGKFINGEFNRRINNYNNDEIGLIQIWINKICDLFNIKVDEAVQEQNRFKITFENILDGIAVIGTDNRIIIANRSFGSFFSYNSSITGKFYYEIIRNSNLNSKIGLAVLNKAEFIFQEKLLNGRNYDIGIRPVQEDRSIQGIIVTLSDVTERLKMEQIKSDLIGNMSHELKTPITILKGYLETIEENQANVKLTSELLRKAVENVDRQDAIINDILKLHMLESGSEIHFEIISVSEIISNCLNLLSPKSALKDIEIINKISGMINSGGNKFLAEEIFYNLIDNAVSYNNPGGKIEIMSVESDSSIDVIISDTGVGIPPESIDRIFERFFRVDKSRSRATGGTGLGLSIVKHACELMKWKIKAESDKNGTSFTVTVLKALPQN